MPTPKAPRWTKRGTLPNVDPQTANEQQLELFDEDMLQLVHTSGTYTLDVGWYPAGSRNGRFICRLIRSEDWERPLQQVEASNIKFVWKWLKHQIPEVATTAGITGTFTAKIGLFLHRRAPKSRK